MDDEDIKRSLGYVGNKKDPCGFTKGAFLGGIV